MVGMESIGVWQVAASLVLVAIAALVGWWLRLGVTRRIIIAALRAGIQLLLVGLLLTAIITARGAHWWAWVWVAVMVAITSLVARRRAPEIPGGWLVTVASVVSATAVCLLVIFGFGILEYSPINVVVIAGITIGNTLPSIVLAGKQLVGALRDGRGQIESLLALGFDVLGVTRFAGAEIARTALIPQIERTNVVGLIALPGAMTGLLLAGTDPVDAVLVQLIVMFLVLGAVATSVVVTIAVGMRRMFTPDLRLKLAAGPPDQG